MEFRLLLVAASLSLALPLGCNKPRPPASEPGAGEGANAVAQPGAPSGGSASGKANSAAAAPAGKPGTDVPRAAVQDSGAGQADGSDVREEWIEAPDAAGGPAPADESQEKLKKMKFTLRRDVVWARSAVANIPSYEQALARFDREFEEWNMYGRVPKSPDVELLRQELEAIVARAGGAFSYLDIREETLSTREIPATIRGDRAFDFEENDIRGILLVTMSLAPADQTLLKAMLAGLKGSRRLLHVLKARLTSEGATLSARAYYFREERFPVHIIEPKNLEEEMRRYGAGDSIEEAVRNDPIGYLQNSGMSVREFNASLPDVNRAMRLLSESKFKEARSAFFRKAVEEADKAVPTE